MNGKRVPLIFCLKKLYCFIFITNFLNSFVWGKVDIFPFDIYSERGGGEVNIDGHRSTSSRYFIGVYIELFCDCNILTRSNFIFVSLDMIDGEVDWKEGENSKVSYRFF